MLSPDPHSGQCGVSAERGITVLLRTAGRRLALAVWLLFFLCVSTAATAQSQLGKDIPFRWYEDTSASLDIEQFVNLPADALSEHSNVLSLGYTRSSMWVRFFLPADLFEGQNRWLQLGPNFLDDITLYYRPFASSQDWSIHRAGDTWPRAPSDIDYRFPVFVLPPPRAVGYDVVIEARSSSALLLDGSLWTPQAFLAESARDTAFWSFYFGLAALSTALAVFAAFFLRRPLAWALCAFSLTYWLVACVQGYVDWLIGGSGFHLQHYFTGILTLLAYTSLLWVTTEALNLRERRAGQHRLMMIAIGLSLLLPLSIPLDLYGLAVRIQGMLCISTAMIIAVGAWSLWRNERRDIMTLVLGLMPALYVIAGIVALMSLFGWIPYNKHVYGLWQYVVMINMLTVLGWVAYRIQLEARETQEKRQLARELKLEREASFHQRQFIGMVSHEFRNPLAVISNAMENLQLPSVSEKQRGRRYLSITRATHRLIQLTDNCLADSRLDADGLQLQMDWVNLLDVVCSAAEIVDSSEDHWWRLTVQGCGVRERPGYEISVRVDAAMLRIAVSNVLDNAVKYSDKGLVDIDLAVRNERIVVGIRDHGPGIPLEDAMLIFERHRRRQAPSTTGHDPGGSGLGLYVARQIVRAHGGEVELARSGPEGSCFELSIPYPPQAASP